MILKYVRAKKGATPRVFSLYNKVSMARNETKCLNSLTGWSIGALTGGVKGEKREGKYDSHSQASRKADSATVRFIAIST